MHEGGLLFRSSLSGVYFSSPGEVRGSAEHIATCVPRHFWHCYFGRLYMASRRPRMAHLDWCLVGKVCIGMWMCEATNWEKAGGRCLRWCPVWIGSETEAQG